MHTVSAYDPLVNRVINLAKSMAIENNHAAIGACHLLAGTLHNEVGLGIELQVAGIDTEFLRDWANIRLNEYPKNGKAVSEPQFDERANSVLEVADMIRLKLNESSVNPLHVFIAISRPGVGFSDDQLKSYPISENQLLEVFSGSDAGKTNGSVHLTAKSVAPQLFESYLTELNNLKTEYKVIGREHEIRNIYETLSKFFKANVLLFGEPGVGKTAIINGFVQFVLSKSESEIWRNRKIFNLSLANLSIGAGYKGELEDRISKVVQSIPFNSILVIEDIQLLFEEKTNWSGVINFIKSTLQKGEIKILATTTGDGLKVNIEKDKSFTSYFEIFRVSEPEASLANAILEYATGKLAKHHNIDWNNEILDQTIRLAKRYLTDRKLPDSSIGLVDQAMASVRSSLTGIPSKDQLSEINNVTDFLSKIGLLLSQRMTTQINKSIQDLLIDDCLNWIKNLDFDKEKKITENDLYLTISRKTGIPMGKMNQDEKNRILNIDSSLKKRVVGQDQAIENISKALKEARSGLNEPGKPIASVFFLGPTGTGKTELAKTLAEFLFDNEKALIRFDMSEFKESHAAALLYGAPPGYVGYEEGGMLVNKIRQQPYSVVLFDEIEKAHSSVFDIFLQIMDDGRLTDKLGKEGDFSNAVVLFSSNIGSEYITKKFNENGTLPSADELKGIMEKYFRKEFLGRISSIVPFAPIQSSIVPLILDIQIKRIKELAFYQGVTLEVDDSAKEYLASIGFNPVYGARPLKDTVRTHIRQPLSTLLIEGKVVNGSKVTAHYENNKLDFIIT